MDGIPNSLLSKFVSHLKLSRIPATSHSEYLQWLRYYLDFCEKYSLPDSKSERVRLFCENLRDKNQTPEKQNRAAHAVSLYLAMLKHEGPCASSCCTETLIPAQANTSDFVRAESPAESTISASTATHSVPKTELAPTLSLLRTSNYIEAGYAEKSDSPEWDAVLERLATEIKVRHYSRKTLKRMPTGLVNSKGFFGTKHPIPCPPPM